MQLPDVPNLGNCRLTGRLDRLWSDGRVDVGFVRVGRRSELDLWIRHLVLCSLVEEGASIVPRSVFVGRTESKKSEERVVLLQQVQDPKTHLARLFDWAWGASMVPLPFFPRTSRAFAKDHLAGKSDQAWRKANQTFFGGDTVNFMIPEIEEDLEMARVWEGASPLETPAPFPVRFSFEELALEFFEPFFRAREVDRE